MTSMVPERSTRVATGSLPRASRGASPRSIRWTSELSSSSPTSKYFSGSRSSSSKNTPSALIFARICLWAEQDTPIPTGQDPPCRGSRATLTSCTKYLPPNWAPIPTSLHIWVISSSHSVSRRARPAGLPSRGRPSSSPAARSFTVFMVMSGLRPPTTTARWYGGHAAVPNARISSAMKALKASGRNTALVFWINFVLFALPPPLTMKEISYSLPCPEKISI
mmetsp:Transcript_26893/g.60671  ORF Transcript_26893/g.60671 Transcript_26893/m.60671 type:complete len:222 (-) Transcript_26893:211-876(-)